MTWEWWITAVLFLLSFLNGIYTFNANLYSQEPQGVYEYLLSKRTALVNKRSVVLFFNNARPHTAWIHTGDMHLLLSRQQNGLNNKRFSQEDQIKTILENSLSSRPAGFFLRVIIKLPDKWEEVIPNNGEYTIHWN